LTLGVDVMQVTGSGTAYNKNKIYAGDNATIKKGQEKFLALLITL
jgi:hypothetical protein